MQRIDKAGAGGVQIETGDVLGQTQLPLEQTGGGGDGVIRSDRGHDARADVCGRNSRPFQGGSGRLNTQLSVALLLTAVSGLDPGAGDDPLVVGVHQAGQILVGHDPLGQTAAGAAKLDPVHGSSFPEPMRRNFSYLCRIRVVLFSRVRSASWRRRARSTAIIVWAGAV